MTRGKGRADCPIGKNPGGRPRKYQQRVLNKDLLLQVAVDRGFKTYKEFYAFLAKEIGESDSDRIKKKMAYGTWTYPDICLVSDALSLTPSEFVGVWFTGLFQEADEGVVFKIPEELRPLFLERKVRSRSGKGRGGRSFNSMVRDMEEMTEFLKSVE